MHSDVGFWHVVASISLGWAGKQNAYFKPDFRKEIVKQVIALNDLHPTIGAIEISFRIILILWLYIFENE